MTTIRLYMDEDSMSRFFAHQQRYSIGEQMYRLLNLVAKRTAEEMQNHVEFLSAWG